MKKSKWEKELEKIGFDFREEQYVGAQDIADTFAANSSPDDRLMLEAPTGSGKTLMYLGVADIEKYPLLISTSGKLLQQQIAESWRCMTGEEAAIIKGRSNYICRNMAEVFRKRLPGTHPHFKSLQMLLDHLKEHPERDISLVASALKWTREFDAFIRNHLLSDSALCLAGRCGEIAESRDLCAYNALLQDASGKQIVITNHHALITITGNNPSGTEKVFSGRKLVVDEAHDLPEATTSVMTKRIGSKTLRRLMNDLGELFEETTADNAYALNIGYMVQGVARLLDTMEGISCADDGYRVFSSLKDVQGIFGGTCSFLEDTRKKIQVADIGRNSKLSDVKLQNLIHRYDAICTELNSFIHPKIDTNESDSPAAKLASFYNFLSLSHGMDSIEPCWAFYLQYDPESKSRELKRTFLNSCFYLLQLWDFFKNVAIVSATLTLPGKPEDEEFNWMAAQLGLDLSNGRYIYHKLTSPFDLRKQCDVFIAAPDSVFFKPSDATPEPYLKACIHMTGKLIRAFQGRTLSLYTASQRLQSADWTLQRVFEELPVCKLLAQHGTADKDELAREFIENHNAALLVRNDFINGKLTGELQIPAFTGSPLEWEMAITPLDFSTNDIYNQPLEKMAGSERIMPGQAFSGKPNGKKLPESGTLRLTLKRDGNTIFERYMTYDLRELNRLEITSVWASSNRKNLLANISMPDNADAGQYNFSLLDASGKVIKETTGKSGGVQTLSLPLNGVVPGKYTIRIRIFDPKGNILNEDSGEFAVLPEKPQWLDNQLGMTNGKVPPPWVPIAIDGNQIKVWGREYKLNQAGLPEQMTGTSGVNEIKVVNSLSDLDRLFDSASTDDSVTP